MRNEPEAQLSYQLLLDLLRGDPSAERSRIFKKWWRAAARNDAMQLEVANEAFARMYARAQNELSRPTLQERAERREKLISAARAAVGQIKRNVLLMELTLPGGKMLRDATFAECAAAGDWFKLVSVKGLPSQIVGQVLTEEELWAL